MLSGSLESGCTQDQVGRLSARGSEPPITVPTNTYGAPEVRGGVSGRLTVDGASVSDLEQALRPFLQHPDNAVANAKLVVNPGVVTNPLGANFGRCQLGNGTACLMLRDMLDSSGLPVSPFVDEAASAPRVFADLVTFGETAPEDFAVGSTWQLFNSFLEGDGCNWTIQNHFLWPLHWTRTRSCRRWSG